MSIIQHFKTFLALIIFSFIFFNYAKGENPKKSDVKLKEWEEHSENIIILDTDDMQVIVKKRSALLLDVWKKDIRPEKLDLKKWYICDKVLAIGNHYGIGISVSNCIISATGRDYGNPYLQLIQTDAAINPGNSGGALINENGNLIGINSKIFSRTGAYQGIGFAIPSNLVVQIATQLIRFGKVKNLWIGNFRVAKVKLNSDNKIIDGLKIIEMENLGPLYEKGVRIKTTDLEQRTLCFRKTPKGIHL